MLMVFRIPSFEKMDFQTFLAAISAVVGRGAEARQAVSSLTIAGSGSFREQNTNKRCAEPRLSGFFLPERKKSLPFSGTKLELHLYTTVGRMPSRGSACRKCGA